MEAVNTTSLMKSALLSKQQKLLLLFQRRNVVEDLSTDHLSSSGSDEDMAKKFHTKLGSAAPLERISALGKISSILKSYEEDELNALDKKLIEGFYNRELNDFSYLARSKSKLLGSMKLEEQPKMTALRTYSRNRVDLPSPSPSSSTQILHEGTSTGVKENFHDSV